MHRAPGVTALLVCVSAATPRPAAPQDDAARSLHRAVSATATGTAVRVQLRGGGRQSGTLESADSTSLSLGGVSGASVRIAYGDVSRFWVRGRSVAAGALGAGGLGFVVGGFFGAIIGSWCEYSPCEPAPVKGAVIGAGLLGAAGAAAGAVVGAAIPRWVLRWHPGTRAQADAAARRAPEPPRVAPVPSPSARRRTGELTLQLVGADGGSDGDWTGWQPGMPSPEAAGKMLGVSASLAFRAGPASLGPEAILLRGTPGVLVLGGVARLDQFPGHWRRVAPYVVLGLADYIWADLGGGSEAYLGASFGLGASLGERQTWRAEARWHPTIQNTASARKPSLITLGVGRRLGW